MLLHRMVWESKHHGYINAYEIGLMTIPQYGKSCFDHYAAYQKVYAGISFRVHRVLPNHYLSHLQYVRTLSSSLKHSAVYHVVYGLDIHVLQASVSPNSKNYHECFKPSKRLS
jgi:hypothetical protein